MTIDADNVFCRLTTTAETGVKTAEATGMRQRARQWATDGASNPVLSSAWLYVLPRRGTMALGCRGRDSQRPRRENRMRWDHGTTSPSRFRTSASQSQQHSLNGILRQRHRSPLSGFPPKPFLSPSTPVSGAHIATLTHLCTVSLFSANPKPQHWMPFRKESRSKFHPKLPSSRNDMIFRTRGLNRNTISRK